MSRRFVLAGVAIVLAVPLTIVLLLDPSSQAACSAVTGSGPSSVPGIPQQYLPYFTGAGSYFQLGSTGWAYLAALNYAESSFGTDNGPGTGVLSGSNYAGAAGPMQIGIGGAATDNWDTVVGLIPANLAGGVEPPSVYNEADAVYGAAALLRSIGAPGDWQAALRHWNDYQPEIDEVNQLVAQYTSTAVSSPTSSAGAVDQSSALSYVAGLGGTRVGFAVVSASGQVLAQSNGDMQVPGASITKAMLLVAYLQQLGSTSVPAAAAAHLAAMIENSSNQDGSWVFAQVGAGAVQRVAARAGMTHFVLDTSDPVYTLGQSLVTALDQARFFARIDQLMPAANRAYGMGLLGSISPADQWGILNARIGVSASKAGWKTEGSVWVVNQAGQLQLQGQTAAIAIVSEGESSQAAGEQIMQTVASDLLGGSAGASRTSAGGCLAGVSGPTVPGASATIEPNGMAAIPQGAPAVVQEMIAAGNKLITYPYLYGGGHDPQSMTIPPGPTGGGYDCSSSTDFILWGGGLGQSLLAGQAPASNALETVGDPGPGQWVTIYSNPGHAFIEIAGVVMDTAWYSSVAPTSPGSGPRWQPASIIPSQISHDSYGWFDVRHPPGL